jgi:AcrR family transcriptional regulator
MTIESATDGRVLRGERSRAAVLRAAAHLATVDGLDGLSIASVAERAGMSKAGVAGLFGTKLQLQLATVQAAREIYIHEVVTPALAVPGGIDRIRAMVEASLGYSERRVFEGGCFFSSTSAELGSRPGPVRDAVLEQMAQWHEFVRRTVQRAVDRGELDADADTVAFELAAILEAANRRSLLYTSAEPYAQARAAIDRVLGVAVA